MIYNIYDDGIDICLFVCLFVCLFQYRYVPCMVYLPTFTPKNHPNLGKSTIHGACGICHDMFFHGILKPHAGHGPHLVRWRRGHPQSRRSPENHGKTRGKPGESHGHIEEIWHLKGHPMRIGDLLPPPLQRTLRAPKWAWARNLGWGYSVLGKPERPSFGGAKRI